MLVLSRKVGEVITIGSSIRITVLSHERGIVRIGIEAPKTVAVHRKEIYDKIIEANTNAAKTEPDALKKFAFSLDVETVIAQESNSLAFIASPKKFGDTSQKTSGDNQENTDTRKSGEK